MKEKFFQFISCADVNNIEEFLSKNQEKLISNPRTWNKHFDTARQITDNVQILNLLDRVQNDFNGYYIDSSDDEGGSIQKQELSDYIKKFSFTTAISAEAFLSKLGLLLHDLADNIFKNKSLVIGKQYSKIKAEYLSLDKEQADDANQNIHSTLVEVIPNVIKQDNQYVPAPEESQRIFNSIFNPYIEHKVLTDNLKKPDILAVPLRQGRNKSKKYVDEELLTSIQAKIDTSFLKPCKDIHFIRTKDQNDASDLLAFSQVVNRVNKNLLKHIKLNALVDWSTSSKFTLPNTTLSPFHTGYDMNHQNSNIQVKEIAGLGSYSKFIFPEIQKIGNKPLFVDTILNIVKNQHTEPLANKQQAIFAEQLVHLLFFVEMQRSVSTLFIAPIFLSLVKDNQVDFLQAPEKFFPMAIEKAVALIRRVMLAHYKKELSDTRLLDYDRDIDTSKSGSKFSEFLSLEGGQLIMWLPDDNQSFIQLKTFIRTLNKIALLTKLNKETYTQEEIAQIDGCFTECVQQQLIQQKPELVNMDAVSSILEGLNTIKNQNTPAQGTWDALLDHLLSQLKTWYNIDCNIQQLLKAGGQQKEHKHDDGQDQFMQQEENQIKQEESRFPQFNMIQKRPKSGTIEDKILNKLHGNKIQKDFGSILSPIFEYIIDKKELPQDKVTSSIMEILLSYKSKEALTSKYLEEVFTNIEEFELKGSGEYGEEKDIGYINSYFGKHTLDALDNILALRLNDLQLNNIKVLKGIFIDLQHNNVSELLNKVISATTSKSLVLINLFNKHAVGLVFEKEQNGSIVSIKYLDSLNKKIPQEFEQLVISRLDSQIRINQITVEQQKYANCGAEVIENFIQYLTGKRISQEKAIELHSKLVENTLLGIKSSNIHLLFEDWVL